MLQPAEHHGGQGGRLPVQGRGSAAGGRGLEAGQRPALAAGHAGPRREAGDAQHPGLARGGVIRLDKTVFLPAADRHGHLHLLRHGPTRRPGRGRGLRLPSSGAA